VRSGPRRPHPLRGAISIGLTVASGLLLVAGFALGWDSFRIAVALFLVAVWLSPRPVWTRMALTAAFAFAWLAVEIWP
jgi:hypothetical protein